MRKILRRPDPQAAPPVSMAIYAQLTPQTDSTLEMKRYSFYTPELQLLAETSTSALTPWIANEYVWFHGEPVAQINVASGETSYYFNDHLGAPILQTDATGAVVWRVERDPYGDRYATRVGADRHQPLGLPGQEYDASSDRQYNIFRWYRPSWGRYTQADPIGNTGDSTLFSYASNNPTTFVDPFGLVTVNNPETQYYPTEYNRTPQHCVGGKAGYGCTNAFWSADCSCSKSNDCKWKASISVTLRQEVWYSTDFTSPSVTRIIEEEYSHHVAPNQRRLYELARYAYALEKETFMSRLTCRLACIEFYATFAAVVGMSGLDDFFNPHPKPVVVRRKR
jgi:RHS repeat-associated protein